VRILLLSITVIVFGILSGCRPLPPKPLDISNPGALAEAFLETLISDDEVEFAEKLVLSQEQLAALVAVIEEEGSVSVNPAFVGKRTEQVEELVEVWQKLRADAQLDGVLWETVNYYGCRYKMMQHPSRLPLSMSFEIYFEVGGYFYRIDISTIAFDENYFVFDKLRWVGEVEKPESVVKK